MNTFLQDIARYYIELYGRDLIDLCFVFPNKRAGVFFSHYLEEESTKNGFPLIHPEVMTISDLISDLTNGIEASRIEQLFILYRCYRDIVREEKGTDEETVDFNKFQYWGEVLLGDFTDVDKYLVDPAEIFRNIEELKEISANYLTPEQIEVIKRYWGEDKVPAQISEFWNHAVHTGSTEVNNEKKSAIAFIRLWQVMHKLYIRFNEELTLRRLTYQGQMYKMALEAVRNTPAEDFPFEKYVFVGFNVLSTVEEKIFETFKLKGKADFFWDFASPTFSNPQNRATTFLKNYVSQFPQPDGAAEIGRNVKEYPLIEVIGVPSVSGQTKIIGDLVKNLLPDADDDSLRSTAIVLPDENLCLPMLNALPENISAINVTMGYPLRNTPVASLISLVISMQLRARKYRFKDTFFHEDVIAVLSHPLIRSISSETCDAIATYIKENRLFNVDRDILLGENYRPLHRLFDLASDTDNPCAVFSYLRELVTWLLDEVHILYKVENNDEDVTELADDEEEIQLTASGAIEAGFLKHYLASLDELERLRRKHLDDLNVDLAESTVFHMVERLVSGESVTFEGRPLKGLQLMGVLETRALDFENVIIASMNERIFPRKHFSRSMIPAAIRQGYGMSTIDHQESLSAYYFYRLITRAKRVFLVYDLRTEGIKSGEPSRYINQLRHIYSPRGMKVCNAFYNLSVEEPSELSLTMTPWRRNQLSLYTSSENPRYISATSINKFIDCPMAFAMSYLEGYYEDNDKNAYFDESTFGSVMHQVVERLYKSLKKGDGPIIVDKASINYLNRKAIIEPEIKRAINRHYLNRDENSLEALPGDAQILSELMCDLVKNMLSHELDTYKEFEFLSGEQKLKQPLRVTPDLTLNFSYTIDRVDRVKLPDGSTLIRIIDYKTGGDEVKSTIDNLFEHDSRGKRNKAILQLFLYCNAYAQSLPDAGKVKIQPIIYSFRTIGKNQAPELIKLEGEVMQDFRQIITTKSKGVINANEEILERLGERLAPLFTAGEDSDFVFETAEHEGACHYCQFSTICSKQK